MSRALTVVVTASAIATPAIAAEPDIISGCAAAIRDVVSGKTCVGADVLKFGKALAGSFATFERIGRRKGTYTVGYGTILIQRGHSLHGHVTSVSETAHKLYMSKETYQCEPGTRGKEA